MKVLVAGTGSIGKRHIRSIQAIDPSAAFVLFRPDGRCDDFSSALGATVCSQFHAALAEGPDFAVIANRTVDHASLIEACLSAGLPFYVEKPVVANRSQADSLLSAFNRFPHVTSLCGCNLRFLASLGLAREIVRSGRIGRVSRASLQVGHWLPDWRPGIDVRSSYSGSIVAGGGVVLDLVHEIDAARWILGEFDIVYAFGGQFSSLPIDSEDTAAIVLGRANGPAVSIGMDYISREPMRRYEFIAENGTLVWDLPTRTLQVLGNEHLASGVGRLPPEAFDVAATYELAMREMILAVEAGESTSQELDEGIRSAMLAVTVNERIRP